MDENANNNIMETKEFKLLFNLLEKAEQILSIINLSETSISKYNTLKKLTFEMLHLDYKPLEKKYKSAENEPNQNNAQNLLENEKSLYILGFLNLKKSMLIDLILNFIVNNNNINEEQNLDYYLNSLTEIYNLPSDAINSKNPNDISYEAKMEESNLSALFTKVDQIFMNTYDNMKQVKLNYENELMQLRESYNKELSELKNNLSGNNNAYNLNPNIESNQFKINRNNPKEDYYLEKMADLIDEAYERYEQNKPNDYSNGISFKDGKFDRDIMKLEFINKVFDNYFNRGDGYLVNKNKNMNMKKDNNNLYYNRNSMDNNTLIREICESLPEIQKENDIFHKNLNDLMNYIETNIEGKVI